MQKLLGEKSDEIASIINLEDILLNMNEKNYKKSQLFLLNSKYVKSKEAMYQLFCALNAILVARPHSLILFCNIIKSLLLKIKKYFSSDELAMIFTNKRIVLILVEKKLIQIQTLINYFIDDYGFLCYFYEEFQKCNPQWIDTQKIYFNELSVFAANLNIKSHRQMRRNAVNEDHFALAIWKDDVTEFQDYVAMNNRSLNSPLKYSIYDATNDLKSLKFIEYAAFCGSINVFKFLWSNSAERTFKLPQMAVCGGNYDIIHIVERADLGYNQDCLKKAIKYHRNEIVDYLVDSIGIEFMLNSLFESIRSFNNEIFCEYAPKIVKNVNEKYHDMTMLHIACINGNYGITYKLTQIPDIDPNARDKSGRTPLHFAAQEGYMNIVKCLVKYTKVNIEAKDLKKVFFHLCKAVLCNNAPIHLASLFCRIDVVKFLSTLQRINVNKTDRVIQ